MKKLNPTQVVKMERDNDGKFTTVASWQISPFRQRIRNFILITRVWLDKLDKWVMGL